MEFINARDLAVCGAMSQDNGVIVLQDGKLRYMELADLLAYVESSSVETDITLSIAGMAADAAAAGAAIRKAAPRNLLDNSDFTNLIAQAGYMGKHGETVYFADRWFKTGLEPSYDPVTRTITFNPGGLSIIDQKVASDISGKTVTFAVKAKNITGTVNLSDVNAQSGHANIPIHDGITTYTFVCGQNTFVRIYSGDGGSCVIDWAALYEGEYTAETLPEYHPKGYAAELAECQRYFYRIKANWKWIYSGICTSATMAIIPVKLPQSMRINPTVTIPDVSKIKVRCGSVASQVPTAITWNFANDIFDIIQAELTVSGATTGTIAMLYFDNGGTIEFSADL